MDAKKCDECGKPTKEIHQAADNSKPDGEHYVYICDACWDKRLTDVLKITGHA
jgi:hypothetical protein